MKRRRHDPRRRLRRTMTGARLVYDGNDGNKVFHYQANGLPMTPDMLDIVHQGAWLWDIEVGVRAKLSDNIRETTTPFSVEQPVRINELTDTLNEMYNEMVEELPAAWKEPRKFWKATLRG